MNLSHWRVPFCNAPIKRPLNDKAVFCSPRSAHERPSWSKARSKSPFPIPPSVSCGDIAIVRVSRILGTTPAAIRGMSVLRVSKAIAETRCNNHGWKFVLMVPAPARRCARTYAARNHNTPTLALSCNECRIAYPVGRRRSDITPRRIRKFHDFTPPPPKSGRSYSDESDRNNRIRQHAAT
jgi:hypothetical protein